MDNLISIIVPIYKVEPYLRQCVDSIINQTYKNLEIILVDDGSPDGCPQICDDYAAKDTRVKVIHKENGGLSSARNAGLDIAKGDYIAFVDSDDWVEKEMYEHLMSLVIKYNVDVATCAVNSVVGTKNTKCKPVEQTENVYKSNDLFDKLFIDAYNVKSEVWNKVYSRQIIGDLRFKVGQIYEDLYFDRILFSKNCLVAVSNYPLYNYRVNREGSTNSFFKNNRFAIFDELDDYIAMFQQQRRNELVELYESYAAEFAVTFYHQASNLNTSKEMKKEIINYFKRYYNTSNKNILKIKKCKMFAFSPKLYVFLANLKTTPLT